MTLREQHEAVCRQVNTALTVLIEATDEEKRVSDLAGSEPDSGVAPAPLGLRSVLFAQEDLRKVQREWRRRLPGYNLD